jgi:Zn-dependent metalloprotease
MFRKFFFVAIVAIGFVMAASEWWYQLNDMLSLFSVRSVSHPMDRREASLGPSRGHMPKLARAPSLPTASAPTWGQNWGKDRSLASATPSEPLSSDFLASAEQVADQFVKEHRDQWQIRPYHDLRPTTTQSGQGASVKYDVYQDGLAIMGMQIRVEVSADLQVTGVNNQYRPLARADLGQSVMSPDEVLDTVSDRYVADAEGHSPSNILISGASQELELAYLIPLRTKGENGQAVQVLFRASDGRELGPQSQVGQAPAVPVLAR